MRRLQRRFNEQHAVIGKHANFMAMNAAPAGHQGIAIEWLELMKFAAVEQPRNNLAIVGRYFRIAADDPVNFLDRVGGRLRRRRGFTRQRRFTKMQDDFPREGEGMSVVFREMVGHAGHGRMHFPAAEGFGIDFLPRRGKGQLRPAEIHEALTAHDHYLIAEGGDIGPTRRARPHDDGDLRDAVAGHPDLIVKDGAELPFIGKNILLIRQERAAAIDQRDDGQAVVPGNALCPHMFLCRHAEIGPALDRRVIGDDHAVTAGNHADPRDNARTRRHVVILAKPGQLPQLKKRNAGVDQPLDPFARQHLAFVGMTGTDLLRPADTLLAPQRMKLVDPAAIVSVILGEFGRRRIESSFQDRHDLFVSSRK